MTSHRIALSVVALALAFTTACGSSNDKDATDKPGASASASSTASPTAPAKKREYFKADKDKKPAKGKTGDQSKNDGNRPSQADLVKALGSANSLVPYKVSDKEANCVAKIVVDSDLTDSAVRALAEKDTSFGANKKDRATLTALNTKYKKKCLD